MSGSIDMVETSKDEDQHGWILPGDSRGFEGGQSVKDAPGRLTLSPARKGDLSTRIKIGWQLRASVVIIRRCDLSDCHFISDNPAELGLCKRKVRTQVVKRIARIHSSRFRNPITVVDSPREWRSHNVILSETGSPIRVLTMTNLANKKALPCTGHSKSEMLLALNMS
jgi:hypothetical protein